MLSVPHSFYEKEMENGFNTNSIVCWVVFLVFLSGSEPIMWPSQFHSVVDDLTSAGAVAAPSQAQHSPQNLTISHSAANGSQRITLLKRPRK